MDGVPSASEGTAGSSLVMPIFLATVIAFLMPVFSRSFTDTVFTEPDKPPSIEYFRSYVSSSVFSGVHASMFVYSVFLAEIYEQGPMPSSSAAAYRIGFKVEPTCLFVPGRTWSY